MNIKLHNLRDYREQVYILVHKIGTKDQLADYLVNPTNDTPPMVNQKMVHGW